jgi:hypothetical protein
VDPDNAIRNNGLGRVVTGDESLADAVKSALDATLDAAKIRAYFQTNHSSGVAEQYFRVFESLARGD